MEEEKIEKQSIKQEIRDKKLGHLIHEGLDGQISLIGFPYSVGATRDGLNKGQENGPDCLRRFLPKVGPVVNPEYGISIENLTLSDYGNISLNGQEKSFSQLLEKLSTKIKSVISKKNIPIVIGGSRDLVISSISSFIKANQGSVISIGSHLDMKKVKEGNRLSISSIMRKVVEDNLHNLTKFKSKVICFGSQSSMVSDEEFTFANTLPEIVEIIPLSQIRKHQVIQSDSILKPSTQAAQSFMQIISNLHEDSQIHLSFALESIHSSYCPGVTRTSVVGGLTGEEATEIAFFAGKSNKFKSLDFTDFNPLNEDFRTGQLLAHLIYNFSMGLQIRQSM